MSERSKHLFQFRAATIAKAAESRAKHHRFRVTFWQTEYRQAIQRVKETAKVEVKEFPVTGGFRADVGIDYGDPTAYRRMQEAYSKIGEHLKAAEAYEMDATTYGSQDRVYELDAADVLHYRLAGGQDDD